MDNKLKITNENGIEEEIEVISFYQLEEYNHEYILYTKGEEKGENIITYISIINEVAPKEYVFETIKDEEELKKVNELINKELEKSMN